MGEGFTELLVYGMKRVHEALGRLRRRFTTPSSDAGQNDTYIDQW